MQQLFLLWKGDELVGAHCVRVYPGTDRMAAARAQLRQLWAGDYPTSDRCTIYMIEANRLILEGEQFGRVGIRQ